MTENELDLLCRHMGHSINVHHSFYRLPSQTLELAKISKLLLAVETGKLNNLSGKKFEELKIEDIADVEDEESDSELAMTEHTESSDLANSAQPDSHEYLMECDASNVELNINEDGVHQANTVAQAIAVQNGLVQ